MNTTAPFVEMGFYHVYNRTNNKESLFKKPHHKFFFLKQYKKYIYPYAYTHAYALLGNHFHFSIQIKNIDTIIETVLSISVGLRTAAMKNFMDSNCGIQEKLDKLIINQFQNFQNSYAKAINKDLNRTGSVFQKKFKRSIYDPTVKFKLLQYYIHHNARKHGFVKDFLDYPHHSFTEIINNNNTIIDVPKILEHFGSIQEFERFHHENHLENEFQSFDLENLDL